MERNLIVFDFDNTLVNTASIIRQNGYNYSFESLMFYSEMLSLLQKSIVNETDVLVLSARNHSYKQQIVNKIQTKIGVGVKVQLVKKHFFKWFYINLLSFRYNVVKVYDDMYYNEENGIPKKLFYPKFSLNNIEYITHDRIVELRGSELL